MKFSKPQRTCPLANEEPTVYSKRWMIPSDFGVTAQMFILEFGGQVALSFIFLYLYNVAPILALTLHAVAMMFMSFAIFRYTGAVLNPFLAIAIAVGRTHIGKLGRSPGGVIWNMMWYFIAHTLGVIIGSLVVMAFRGVVPPPAVDLSTPTTGALAFFISFIGMFGLTLTYMFVTHGDCHYNKSVPNNYFGYAIGGCYFVFQIIMFELQGGVLDAHYGFVQNIIWAISTGTGWFVGVAFFYWGAALVGGLLGVLVFKLFTKFWKRGCNGTVKTVDY